MTRILPQGTDTLNNPSHSFQHRVVSVDSSSPQSSIDIDSVGNVTIAASVITPSLVGGSAAGSKITYKSTTGTGTAAGIAHQWVGGTNGGTVIATMLNNGNVGIGTTAPTYKLDVKGLTQASGIKTDMGLDLNPVLKPTFVNGNLALAAGGSNLGVGVYIYSLTYITALGETDVSGDATITTDASNRKVTITLPTSTDPRVTGRRIYRSYVGQPTYASKVIATIADNTTTTYLDDIADVSMTGATAYYRSNNTSSFITVNGSQIFNVTANGNANTFFGYRVGNNTLTQGRNIGYGSYVMSALTTGNSNVALGNTALNSDTIGNSNIGVGYGVLYFNTSGNFNIAMGHDAGFYNATGLNNVNIGAFSAFGSSGKNVNNSTSLGHYTNYLGTSYSVNLGTYAGMYETANNNLFIDSLDRGTEAGARSAALIYGVFSGIPANQILSLGGGGKVGIGTVSPTAKLDINSDIIRIRTAKTPATSGAAGNQGDMCWDAGFLYICVATNTWMKATVATW